MKGLIIYVLILFSVALHAQYEEWNRPIHQLTSAIQNEIPWKEVQELVENDTILVRSGYADDISSTIEFLNKGIPFVTSIAVLIIMILIVSLEERKRKGKTLFKVLISGGPRTKD